MAKKDFTSSISNQWEAKTGSVLETKLHQAEDENTLLKEKIKELESSKTSDLSIMEIGNIKLLTNIRDTLEYEDIDSLAEDIKKHGQLQPVLLSQDNYLIAGYRRYHAIKLLAEKDTEDGNIICYKLKRNHDEIPEDELQEIQLAENDQRRNIDYFQLSKLYNSYKENVGSQKELTNIFKKSKGTISAILKINNIDPVLVNYLKQFQIYAWSKNKFDKFAVANFDELNEKDARFYNDNKGIIGWRPLYEIAKNDDINIQKKVFLKLYKNRLTEEELDDFSIETEEDKKSSKEALKKTSKQIDSILKNLDKNIDTDFKKSSVFEEINYKFQEIKELITKQLNHD